MKNRFWIRTIFILHLSCFILLLNGCTSKTENIPVWMLTLEEEYPVSSYLAAVGEGDTRRSAENSALGGLARMFEAEVNATETLAETTEEMRGKKDSFEQRSRLDSDVQIGSSQNLLNVQFGEAFTDSRGRIHITAFLDRTKTAEIYRAKITDTARDIVFLIQQSDAAKDPAVQYAFRRAASRKAEENDRLLDQLRIIHPQAHKTLSLYYDPQELYAETAAAARNITFSISMTAGPAREALVRALTVMGFSEKDEYPSLNVSGKASFEKTDIRRESLVFVRYSFEAEIRDRQGILVLAFDSGSREGHVSFDEARKRAERALSSSMAPLLRRELGRWFDRLVEAK